MRALAEWRRRIWRAAPADADRPLIEVGSSFGGGRVHRRRELRSQAGGARTIGLPDAPVLVQADAIAASPSDVDANEGPAFRGLRGAGGTPWILRFRTASGIGAI